MCHALDTCSKLRNGSESHKGSHFLFNRGLGLERIFVNFLKVYCDVANLVLVLNTTQLEEVGICIFLNSFLLPAFMQTAESSKCSVT